MSVCLFFPVAWRCFKRVNRVFFFCIFPWTHTHTQRNSSHFRKNSAKDGSLTFRAIYTQSDCQKKSRRGRAVFGMTVYLLPLSETENECYTSQLLFSHYHYSPSGTTLSVSVAAWEVHFHQHLAKRDDKLWVPPRSYTIVKKFLSTCQPSLSSVILL